MRGTGSTIRLRSSLTRPDAEGLLHQEDFVVRPAFLDGHAFPESPVVEARLDATQPGRKVVPCPIRLSGKQPTILGVWLGTPEGDRAVPIEIAQLLGVEPSRTSREALPCDRREPRPAAWNKRPAIGGESLHGQDKVAIRETGRYAMSHRA